MALKQHFNTLNCVSTPINPNSRLPMPRYRSCAYPIKVMQRRFAKKTAVKRNFPLKKSCCITLLLIYQDHQFYHFRFSCILLQFSEKKKKNLKLMIENISDNKLYE